MRLKRGIRGKAKMNGILRRDSGRRVNDKAVSFGVRRLSKKRGKTDRKASEINQRG